MRRGRWRRPRTFASRTGLDVEVMWGDEGFVVAFPEVEAPPDPALLLPDATRSRRWCCGSWSNVALRGAFRETAARALLLPRRRPGMPHAAVATAQARRGSARCASRFGSFPALLETYREVPARSLRHAALCRDAAGLQSRDAARATRSTRRSRRRSPRRCLFSYVANYIYDGDAPLAERRAQALSVDQAQLRELLGDAELRELLDPDACIRSNSSSSTSTTSTRCEPLTACTIFCSASAT
jgi:ATP-dependent Lhr-like helicase